jgi:hypothetical protein
MTIERLNFPEGYPVNSAMEINFVMTKERKNFAIVPPGEIEIAPTVKPKGFKYSRTLTVGEKGAGTLGPNINPDAVVFEVATHPAGKVGKNGKILLENPGDIFILTTPGAKKGTALLQEIILFSNKKIKK